MTIQTGTLNTVIAPFEAFHFEKLYTQEGGYLRYNGKEWVVSKIAISRKDKASEYALIIKELCTNGLPQAMARADQEALLTKINDYFTDVKNFLVTPNQETGEIRFNSKVEGYQFLSNFYSTLLLSPENQVFTSLESFFHIHLMRFMKKVPLPDKLTDPKSIKKLGDNAKAKWIEESPLMHTDEKYNRMAEKIMLYALRSKFNLNPKLKALLLATKDTPLVEESTTSLHFGSTKDPQGAEMGKNKLGEILMTLRKEFREKAE